VGLPVETDYLPSDPQNSHTSDFKEMSTMRYLKIVLLLLGVTVGTQACIIPIPVGGGGGHRHHRDDWR